MNTGDEKTRFKAIGANAGVEVICERFKAGEVAVCPKCDSDLIVAFTWETANEHGGHPGIFCPSDSRHYQVTFNIARQKQAAPKEE